MNRTKIVRRSCDFCDIVHKCHVQRSQSLRHCSKWNTEQLEGRYGESWLPLLPVPNPAGGLEVVQCMRAAGEAHKWAWVSAAGSGRLPCCKRAIAREIRAAQGDKGMERC